MSKYYVPTIEEFHVGFRYESYIAGSGDDYSKEEYSRPRAEFIFSVYGLEAEEAWIRTKYLDKSDIEELGWEWSPDGKLAYGDWMDCYYLHTTNGETHKLTYVPSRQSVRIVHKSGVNTSSCIFFGICKNYNELKKIMKMLVI